MFLFKVRSGVEVQGEYCPDTCPGMYNRITKNIIRNIRAVVYFMSRTQD